MAFDLPHAPNDAQLLYEYLGHRLEEGVGAATAAEVLAELHAYSSQLANLRAKIQEAEESLARGEAAPLDVDALLAKVRGRLEGDVAKS